MIASGPAATVSPVLPMIEPSVAEIVAVPVVSAEASPAVLITATSVLEDAQVT